MEASQPFSVLMADLCAYLGVDAANGSDESALLFELEDGVKLHLIDSGADLFALIADTGSDLSAADVHARAKVMELCLQINFAALLSSRLVVAQSPDGALVLTLNDRIAGLDGRDLLETVDFMIEKAREFRGLVLALMQEASETSKVDLAGDAAQYFNQRA